MLLDDVGRVGGGDDGGGGDRDDGGDGDNEGGVDDLDNDGVDGGDGEDGREAMPGHTTPDCVSHCETSQSYYDA